MKNRAAFDFLLILTIAAAVIVGYTFADIGKPVALVIAVTTTPLPTATAEPTATPTPSPISVSGSIALPDCSEPDTPSGTLCARGKIVYGDCDLSTPVSREPCYKP